MTAAADCCLQLAIYLAMTSMHPLAVSIVHNVCFAVS